MVTFLASLAALALAQAAPAPLDLRAAPPPPRAGLALETLPDDAGTNAAKAERMDRGQTLLVVGLGVLALGAVATLLTRNSSDPDDHTYTKLVAVEYGAIGAFFVAFGGWLLGTDPPPPEEGT
jgi:hypothetical protein